jgi:hypothetical protein
MSPPHYEADRSSEGTPRISIVVNNHNYDRYLSRAVDSALAQDGADVEVIVVDNGSTDRSREVIEGYGDRVLPVLQDDRGQKGAFNAGFEAATGGVVMFLDSDDELRPGIAAAVARAFAAHPEAARVIFRLEIVDEAGRPTGATVPSAAVPLPDGDVTRAALSWPDDLAWPPTSGNAFPEWALRRLLPLPVDEDSTGADYRLHPLVPLFGPVVGLDLVGGCYRLHGANVELSDGLDVAKSRRTLERAPRMHADLDRLARELGHRGARPRSVTLVAHRVVSLRLGGPGHPIMGDTRLRVLRDGLRAAVGRRDARPLRRLGYAAFFLTTAVAPRTVVRALAERSLEPVRRKPLLPRRTRR